MNADSSLDEQLIRLLQKDALQSSNALAKQLSVSSATVRRRLAKLIRDEKVRIVAVADPGRVGFPLMTAIALKVDHAEVDSVVEKLTSYIQTKWISVTTGRFDVMAIAIFSSTGELSNFLQKELPGIGGVKEGETFICLEVRKVATCRSELTLCSQSRRRRPRVIW